MQVCFQQLSSLAQHLAWAHQPFTGFCIDSRQLKSGQIFIALSSYSQPEKTQQFVLNALQNGAIGVISEQVLDMPNVLHVANVRQYLGIWQQQFLQHHTHIHTAQALLPIIAVTGTNGKTTISRLVAELLSLNGQRCAVMGTTGNGILPQLSASTHTTLDALQLQTALHDYATQGATYAALEASSHGLDQYRLNGCNIQIAIYSNLSRDHLDYHGSFEAYAAAKAQLFAFPSLKVAIINLDDAHADLMLTTARSNPAQPKIIGYSCRTHQPINASDINEYDLDEHDVDEKYQAHSMIYDVSGTQFTLSSPTANLNVHSPFLGQFNVENLVASLIAVAETGLDLISLSDSVMQLQGAPGRMQVLRDAERVFVVDYAHSPDALLQVLKTLKQHVFGQLWAVFGCGGDRDRGKRPLMTQVALAHADQVLLTLDNPRNEDPAQIFSDMRQIDLNTCHAAGIEQIDDRRKAIRHVVAQAQAGDIVLIAGKGHENYQEIQGVRHWFDDAVELQAAIDAQYHRLDQAYPAQ